MSGAWVPALVFGIPGDTITAIAIGVLILKGMDPGPTVFINTPDLLYAVFIAFFLANLLLIPLGWVAIRSATQILRVPRGVLILLITMFCVVGAFAVTNSTFSVIVMAIFGVLAYLMEENGFPVAPTILGIVLGGLLEQSFMTAMMKADGNLLAFFERPIAATLGVITLLIWLSPPALGLWRKRLLGADAQASSTSSRT